MGLMALEEPDFESQYAVDVTQELQGDAGTWGMDLGHGLESVEWPCSNLGQSAQ